MNNKVTIILAELRRRLEVLYGERLVQMMLFGSQARGDAEPESDIDVLVVLRGKISPCEEIDRTIKDAADLSLHHEVRHAGDYGRGSTTVTPDEASEQIAHAEEFLRLAERLIGPLPPPDQRNGWGRNRRVLDWPARSHSCHATGFSA
jgi:predicted nucleotidyltransferase